jgi:methyl-accepting chemotaxis protein
MKWTIKTRLISGCVLLLVVIAVACTYGLSQMSSAETKITDVARRSETNVARLKAVQDAKDGLLTAREEEAKFRLVKKTEIADSMRKDLAKAREALGRITEGGAGDELAKPVGAAITSAEKYEAALDTMVTSLTRRGLTPEQGLEGELRKAVQTIETLINEQNIPELSVIMLMCRRHEKDYLLRGDPKYLGDITKRIGEFTAKAKGLGLAEDLQAKAAALWTGYHSAMEAVVNIDAEVRAATEASEAAADQFTAAVGTVSKAVEAAIAADQSRARAVMATGRMVMLILLGAGLCIGTIVAIILTRSINKPLEAAVNMLQTFVEQTTSAATQISGSSQQLADGASRQAASLEETSASLEEMSSMTKRNAEAAQNAKQIAGAARTIVDNGASSMEQMVSAMGGIKSSSAEIAKIIKTIDEIAFQTNILALNAAVEAARAGEAGAGFAVVAEEVRALAQRSASAAKETAGKIDAALQKSEEGARISTEVSAILTQIVGQVRSMDTLVGEIAGASGEQSQGIAQVNQAVAEVDRVTQANASGAEESAAAAEELAAQSHELQKLVVDLQHLVGVKPAQTAVASHIVRPSLRAAVPAASAA